MFIAIALMMGIILSLGSFIGWFGATREFSLDSDQILEPIIVICASVLLAGFFGSGLFFLFDEFILGAQMEVQVVQPRKSYDRSTIAQINPEMVIEELE